jgi:uncharacterized protein (DUF427 family)
MSDLTGYQYATTDGQIITVCGLSGTAGYSEVTIEDTVSGKVTKSYRVTAQILRLKEMS